MYWISASEAEFPVHLGPEMIITQIFNHFLKMFHWLYIILVLYAHRWGYFRCISMVCAKGPISGPRIKVAAELVGPSGLVFSLQTKCYFFIQYINCVLCLLRLCWRHFKFDFWTQFPRCAYTSLLANHHLVHAMDWCRQTACTTGANDGQDLPK